MMSERVLLVPPLVKTCTDSLRDPGINSWLVQGGSQPLFLNPAEVHSSRNKDRNWMSQVLVSQWDKDCQLVQSKTTKVKKCDAVGCDGCSN